MRCCPIVQKQYVLACSTYQTRTKKKLVCRYTSSGCSQVRRSLRIRCYGPCQAHKIIAWTRAVGAIRIRAVAPPSRAHQPTTLPQWCIATGDAVAENGPQRQSSAHRQLRHAQKKRPEAFISCREAAQEVAPNVLNKQGARAGAEESSERRAEEEIDAAPSFDSVGNGRRAEAPPADDVRPQSSGARRPRDRRRGPRRLYNMRGVQRRKRSVVGVAR